MTDADLLSFARAARKTAYAPYSGFHVGAAILSDDGEVFTGCNVENSSFGLTVCAERNAVGRFIREGKRFPVAIAVVGGENFCFPCGACRQVLSEFNPKMKIILEKNGEIKIFTLDELLPFSFKLEASE